MIIETRNHTLNTSHGLLAEEESGQGKLPLLLMPVFGLWFGCLRYGTVSSIRLCWSPSVLSNESFGIL